MCTPPAQGLVALLAGMHGIANLERGAALEANAAKGDRDVQHAVAIQAIGPKDWS